MLNILAGQKYGRQRAAIPHYLQNQRIEQSRDSICFFRPVYTRPLLMLTYLFQHLYDYLLLCIILFLCGFLGFHCDIVIV